jgi:hypothetical protein
LDTLEEKDSLNVKVDQCLSRCIQGANYDFIKRFTRGQLRESIAGVKVSSVVALSSQLLTIDARIMKRKNIKLMKEVNALKAKVEESRIKLIELKQARECHKREQRPTNDSIKKLNETKLFKQQDNANLVKQINNSKSLLFQELINIYIIKRRKISGSHQSVFMISFTPLISCQGLVDFNYEVVNASLNQVCKFVKQAAKVLLVVLPFDIGYKNGIHTICDIEVWLPDKQVWELDNSQLKQFIRVISMAIMDVYEVLRTLELTTEIKTYGDLLQLDSLVYKLANNGYEMDSQKGKLLEEEVVLETLINTCHESVLGRIKNKDNEWHVVKREYLE